MFGENLKVIGKKALDSKAILDLIDADSDDEIMEPLRVSEVRNKSTNILRIQ